MAINKKHKHVINYIVVFILFFIIVCFSPYLFILINDLLNTWFPNQIIQQSDYLSYISAVSTGIVAIAISILALIISSKAEHREQNQLQIAINSSKKELKDFIILVCASFFQISKSQKSMQDMDFKRDISPTIEMLKVNGIINDTEWTMCREMQDFINQAFDKTRSETDTQLSLRFCQKFIEMGAPDFSYKEDVMNLLHKISTKGADLSDQETQ